MNTHVHGDHTGGNENLAGLGALIFSRDQLPAEEFVRWLYAELAGPQQNGACSAKISPPKSKHWTKSGAPGSVYLDMWDDYLERA